MKKNIKTNQSKITTIRLTNQNRSIVENECKKLNISINNFVNYLIELFDSVNENEIDSRNTCGGSK